MSFDPTLVRAWTSNIQQAIVAGQVEHAETLLDHLNGLLSADEIQEGPEVTLHYALGLDRGIARQYKPNEDFPFAHHWQVFPRGQQALTCGLFIVADGMGGHEHGREASQVLVQTLVDFILPATRQASFSGSPDQVKALLEEGIQRGNQLIFQRNSERVGDMMGTTITALFLAGPVAVIANIGDSRTYLVQTDHQLQQITVDHSVVAGMLARGEITEDEAFRHPKKNQIFRSIGQMAQVQIDLFVRFLADGDCFLLCSDGLSDMLRDREIAPILVQDLTVEEQVEHLVASALRAGGRDNVSVIVLEVRMDVAGVNTLLITPSTRERRAS